MDSPEIPLSAGPDGSDSAEDQFCELADSVLSTAMTSLGSSEFAEIWSRFHRTLKNYVHQRLSPRLQGRGQASDIMQSALLSFWKKLEAGAVSYREDPEQLWPYLAQIARRKLSRMWRRIYAKKRAGGKEFTAGDFVGTASHADVRHVVYDEAELQLQVDLETIMARLDVETQAVCSLKLAGMKNEEIAHELSCSTRKVERKGELLRKLFAEYLGDDESAE